MSKYSCHFSYFFSISLLGGRFLLTHSLLCIFTQNSCTALCGLYPRGFSQICVVVAVIYTAHVHVRTSALARLLLKYTQSPCVPLERKTIIRSAPFNFNSIRTLLQAMHVLLSVCKCAWRCYFDAVMLSAFTDFNAKWQYLVYPTGRMAVSSCHACRRIQVQKIKDYVFHCYWSDWVLQWTVCTANGREAIELFKELHIRFLNSCSDQVELKSGFWE